MSAAAARVKLMASGRAEAQYYYYPTYPVYPYVYNPYVPYVGGVAAYNPYTGGVVAGHSYYNPYTGGAAMGLRHGRFFKHDAERPLGDLYVTMLKQFGIPVDSFAENVGEFSEILA